MKEETRQRINAGEYELLYHTRTWKRKREDILKRDHYECQRCLGRFGKVAKTKITKANTVHHIKELEVFPHLALEDDNLISLCHDCHDIIHGRTPFKINKKKKRIDERW